MSDPLPPEHLPTLEDWMSDVGAVLDHVGIERAALIGVGILSPRWGCMDLI